jgi:hypothetical protein
LAALIDPAAAERQRGIKATGSVVINRGKKGEKGRHDFDTVSVKVDGIPVPPENPLLPSETRDDGQMGSFYPPR